MYSVLAIALLLSCPGGKEADNVPADTLVNIDVEEAVVVASPKETAKLRRQPVSVSIFGREALRENDVCAIKGLSAVAPNFFCRTTGRALLRPCISAASGRASIRRPWAFTWIMFLMWTKVLTIFIFWMWIALTFCAGRREHYTGATRWEA